MRTSCAFRKNMIQEFGAILRSKLSKGWMLLQFAAVLLFGQV